MKKISKKLVAMVMCLVLLVGVMPITALAATTVDSGSCGEDVSWKLTDDGVLTISGKGNMYDYYEEDPEWFDYADGITSVVIQNGVTGIGAYAFYANINLAEITIPSSLRDIGEGAFSNCLSLEEITIPNGVTNIGMGAFEYCMSLAKVTIPASVTNIDFGAFFGCYSLEKIEVNSNNTVYSSDNNGNLFDKDKTVIICASAGLTSYSIPDSVDSIESFAFTNSLYMEELTISANVENINVTAFLGCASLTELTVAADNPYFSADERGVLFDKEKLALYYAPTGITGTYAIPDSVIVIYPYAFSICIGLTEVIIPDSVEDIGLCAFASSGITTITIPASVTYLDDEAFVECAELTEIRFEGDAPEIGEFVFEMVTATAYYPEGNETWTSDVRESFGGDITWSAYSTDATHIMGDINGDGKITNADLVAIARYIVGAYAGTENAEKVEMYGDITEDGRVTNADLVRVSRIIVGA